MDEAKGQLLLLVEDEAIIALETAARLTRYGYRVLCAHTGDSALGQFRQHGDIELVLMDIDLGKGRDGTELAREMLAMREVPVVFMSSHSEPEVIERTEKVSSYGYIVKGSADPAILASLRMALALYKTKQTAQSHAAALASSERRVRTILDNLGVGLLAADPETGRFVYANATMATMLGRQTSEFINLGLEDIHPPESLETVRQQFDRFMRGEDFIAMQIPLLRRDGMRLQVDISASRMKLEGRNCVLGLFTPCTDSLVSTRELALFRLAVENASDGIGFSTPQGRHYYQNRAFDEMFGPVGAYPPDDLYVSRDIGNEVFSAIMRGDSWNGEVLMYDRERRPKAILLRAYAVKDTTGDIQALVGMHTDISQRKAMERTIREQRDMAQLYLDLAGVIFIVLDRFGTITMINRCGCAVLGQKAETIVGRNWFENYLPPSQVAQTRTVFDRIMQGELGLTEFHENDIITAGGERRVVAWHNSIIRDDMGAIIGSISAGEDITERRKAERELLASEEKHRFLFEHMTQGVVYHAPDGAIVQANQAAADILGLSLAQLLGKDSLDPLWRCIHYDGSPYPGTDHPVMRTLRTGQAVHNDLMGVYIPGIDDFHWIRINSIPKIGPDGQLELVMIIFDNITSNVRFEQGLQRQIEEKNILIRETHHRIKNNIATIGSLLSMQAGESSSSETSSALQEAISRVESMQTLYQNMLLSDDYQNVAADTYLEALAGSVLELYGSDSGIDLRCNVEPIQLPPKTMFLLGIIVNELLTNVMKYAFPDKRPGTIGLDLRAEAQELVLSIKDDGVGLPAGFSAEQSTGFGIMLVRMLSEQLKGRFAMSGSTGGAGVPGTTATLRLPRP